VTTRSRRLLEGLDDLQRRHPALGFVVGVQRKFASNGAGRLAAVLAFYAFFSFFPLLLVVTTVLGRALASRPGLRTDLLDSVLAQFPVVGSSLRDKDTLHPLQGSLTTLLVGIVGALWGGLRAMQAAQHAMNDVWDVPRHERPNAINVRLRALLVLVVVGAGLLGTVALSSLAALLPVPAAGRIALVLGTLVADSLTFLVAFQVLTARKQPWGALAPGAAFAGVGWFAVQLSGTWFVARAIKGASDVYGTFAAVIGFLTLFHVQAQLSLYAAEINVVRARRLWPRSLTGRDPTDADRRAALDEANASIDLPGASVEVRYASATGSPTPIPSQDDPRDTSSRPTGTSRTDDG
jgi:YihY family inner membrane protein